MVDQTLDQEPKLPINPEVKARVSEALNKPTPTTVETRISDNDKGDLRHLADSGDSVAALLLGSAVWLGLADPEDDFDQFVLVAGKDRLEGPSATSC